MDLAIRPPSTVHLQRYALLLLVAWLPSLAFFGHWDALAAPILGSPVATHQHPSPGSEHERHCHTGVAGCSEGAASVPLPASGPSQQRPVAAAESAATLVVLDDAAPAAFHASPVTPPPRTVR